MKKKIIIGIIAAVFVFAFLLLIARIYFPTNIAATAPDHAVVLVGDVLAAEANLTPARWITKAALASRDLDAEWRQRETDTSARRAATSRSSPTAG